MLRLEAVCKRYGRGRWVLQDVDLEIPAGEVAAIAGANGSGKSTLLRLLVGLSRPTRGTVSGQPEVIGYVPDRFSPQERLSAMEYLTHLGRIRGLSTRVAAARADQLVDRLALVGGKQSPLRTLSRGNAQKVALAQALLVQPQLLVLDEPWSGLDASQAYVVSAGQVTRGGTERAIDGRPKIDVVLTEPSGPRKPREVDWYAVDGVLDVTSQAETITVRVVRDCSDALLLTALQHGWSVTSLGPIVENTRTPSAGVNRNAR